MHYFYFTFLLCFTSVAFGQQPSKTDSLQTIFSTDFLKTRRAVDSTLHPIKYQYPNANTLEKLLLNSFPESATYDGRWVFYPDKANIQKLSAPFVQAVIPNTDFYNVVMTSFLGYHVNQGTCLVLVDSSKSKTMLVEPLWYDGTSTEFLKLFIKYKFDTKDLLIKSITQLNELMQIGSGYKFRQTSCTDTLITYDLGYFKDDSYTTGGNGTSSIVSYNEDGVLRKIRIEIKDWTIVRYVSINPKMNDKEVVE